MSPGLAEAGGRQVWADWAPACPDCQACQASRMVGREARAGEDHRRTRESSSPCLGSCSFSHLVCPSPAKAHVRHFLRAGEQATANEFSKNER